MRKITVLLFVVMLCFLSLPVVYRIAETSSYHGMTGVGTKEVVGYYAVDSNCVLYHAYWDSTATDHSSYGNNGTVVGATFVENGLYFITDDYVSCDDSASLDIGTAGIFTIFVWRKYVGGGGATSQAWFGKGGDGAYAPYVASFTRADTVQYFLGSQAGDAWDTNIAKEDSTKEDGNWYLLTIRSNGTNSATMHLNTTLRETDTSPANAFYDNAGPLIIGAACGASPGYTVARWLYAAYIGEILIFKTDLGNVATPGSDANNFYNSTKARYGL